MIEKQFKRKKKQENAKIVMQVL